MKIQMILYKRVEKDIKNITRWFSAERDETCEIKYSLSKNCYDLNCIG